MADLEAFRRETRAWLLANAPQSMFTPLPSTRTVLGRPHRHLREPRGEAVARRHGGARLDRADLADGVRRRRLEQRGGPVLAQEMAALRLRPPLVGFGLTMIGPTLLQVGTEALKRAHLPPIVRGEIRWCQGYSEPGSGSDLASLQTRAVVDGDDFVVNGQKVWTSYADQADWMFLLVRTDPARKHDGITFLLMDMASPGVSVKPIS